MQSRTTLEVRAPHVRHRTFKAKQAFLKGENPQVQGLVLCALPGETGFKHLNFGLVVWGEQDEHEEPVPGRQRQGPYEWSISVGCFLATGGADEFLVVLTATMLAMG